MFTKKFLNTLYKQHREELLFEREISLMPATQLAIQRETRRRELTITLNELRKLQSEKYSELNVITNRIHTVESAIYTGNFIDTDDMKSASTFVMKCSHENCKGFLSKAYKCGTCSQYTCPDCHEPKNGRFDPIHVCDDIKKQNVQLITRDCKPCPSCGVFINKSEGCPQMFCTQCNILFDWNTLKVLNSRGAHNPHYIQWLRENGRQTRNVADVLCGGFPDIAIIARTISESKLTYLEKIMRCCLHIHHYERPRYQINWNNDEVFETLRVKWALNDINDSEFKVQAQRLEKKRTLNSDIGLVMEGFINSMIDTFQLFLHINDEEQLLSNCEQLRDIFNTSMNEITTSYNNKTPYIELDWKFISKYN
tara:strand:+ start:1597 stop:2697 length:1101 start_codon:yes stop_codon:yes gene_type:complete